MHPYFEFAHRIRVIPAALAACSLAGGCATAPTVAPPERAASVERIDALTPDSAAARAVATSPRVHAAALRADAQAHRTQAALAPPDPSIAIAIGIPIDGMGGLPVTVSIMQGLAWLLNGEAIRDAAERERDSAARELVATATAVAAEARGLARGLAAAREARSADESAWAERDALLAIERESLALGESTDARVAALELASKDAREDAADARMEEERLALALASLLGAGAIGTIEPDHSTVPMLDAVTSLEIEQARVRLARAEAIVRTAEAPLGSDARGGTGFQRDLDGRESVGGSLEFALPVFRRPSEIAALRADARAARADLDEAERTTRLALRQAHGRAARLEELMQLDLVAAELTERVRGNVEHAFNLGESTRASLADARAAAWQARAHVARRRMELAAAIAAIESRSARPQEETAREASSSASSGQEPST